MTLQVDISREEELTLLIEALFDWIEKESPGLLKYGEVNFRTILERYFYFSALIKPSSLRPLLDATELWYESAEDGQLKSSYEKRLEEIQPGSRKGATHYLRVFWHLSRLVVANSITRLLRLNGQKLTAKDYKPVAFFAFSDRFVFFFKELVSQIDPEKCVFLTSNGLVSNTAVSSIKAKLAEPESVSIEWSKVKIKAGHPLFFPYLIALRKYAMSLAMLIQNNPKVVIFAEGTSVEDESMALAAKCLKIPTVRVQSGRAGELHIGYRGMSFDKMLCWGEGFVKRFRTYSPRPAYYSTGSPLLDEVSDKSEIGHENQRTVAFFTQPISSRINSNDYQQLVDLAERLLASHDDIAVLVRKHPVDRALKFDELIYKYGARVSMMNMDTHSLAEVLKRSEAAIGFYSTTLSEAAAYGVIPVILKLKEQHSVFPFPEKYGAAIVAHNLNEAFVSVSQILYQPETANDTRENMKKFSLKYFGPRDGLAMQRILKLINQTIEDGSILKS